MKQLAVAAFFCILYLAGAAQSPGWDYDVWINEIHYNNTGDDTLQGFEIAGPQTINLSCYQVILYNGSNGQAYDTITLSGAIGLQQDSIGTIWFPLPQDTIQNTVNGGFALAFAPQATGCGLTFSDTLLQFLSYGGPFTATSGVAAGHTSTNIPVAENGSTPVGYSLQLQGQGYNYGNFTWQGPLPATYSQPNTNQVFRILPPIVEFVVFPSASVTEGDSQQFAIWVQYYNDSETTADINVTAGGTAYFGTNFTYAPIEAIFPGGVGTDQLVTVYTIDDSIADGNKFFTFKLNYPANNAALDSLAVLGPNYELVINILNDDTAQAHFLAPFTDTVLMNASVINIPVSLSLESSDTISVNVSVNTAATTGVRGVDYSFDDTVITWLPYTRGTILVPLTVINDSLAEPDRTVQLQLSNPTGGGVLTDSIFTLTILELGDTIHSVLNFVGTDTIVPQTVDTVELVVELTNPGQSTDMFTLVYDNSLSTAIQGYGNDFVFANQAVTLTVDSAPVYDTFYVTILQNNLIQPTKTIVFKFIDVSTNTVVGNDSVYTIYITNNNVLTVSFLGAGFSVLKDSTPVEVPVVLSTFSPFPTSVDVTLAPGSAVEGVDFTFTDTTVTFPAFSDDTEGVWVNIINNDSIQPNKQVNFNLSNATNGAALGITAYTLTIINDDSTAGISQVNSDDDLKIFPDPVGDILNIRSNQEFVRLQVVDLPGRVIIDETVLPAGTTTLNVQSLAAGVYFINVVCNNKVYCRRFVKSD